MLKRILIFLFIAATFLGLSGFYLGMKFMSWSTWADHHSSLVWLSLAVLLYFSLLGPLLGRLLPERINSRLFFLHWLTSMSLGVTFCFLFYTVAVDIGAHILSLFLSSEARLQLPHFEIMTVLGLVLFSTIAGTVQAAFGPKIYETEIPIDGLPTAFHGFKIAQISDLHIGSMIGHKYVENVVQKTNGLEADIVALTGDIVDGSLEKARAVVPLLGNLRSKFGTHYITGNHEYYWKVQNTLSEMRNIGAKILINEHVTISIGESRIVLAGVTDVSAGAMEPGHRSDPVKAISGAPNESIKILLAHQPGDYKRTSSAGFHLQLSGHTHGGQFFPWSLVVRLAQRYYRGLNRFENMWIYVNRGTATWGPPLRFLVPAEISLLTLIQGQKS